MVAGLSMRGSSVFTPSPAMTFPPTPPPAAPLVGPTLAQIPTPITVPPLPSGSLFDRYILEDTWALGAILALAAAVAIFLLLKQQRPAMALCIGGSLAAACAAVLLAGWLVETPREIVSRNTQEMVFAVARQDRPALTSLLAPEAQLTSSPRGPAEGRAEILSLVESYSQLRGNVQDHAVLEVQASQDGPNTARTQVLVRVWAFGAPVFSWWRLDFRRTGDGSWTCTRIEELWDSGQSPSGSGPR